MWKDIAKQMLPFLLLLAVLWLAAEVLDRTIRGGNTIIAPPAPSPATAEE